MRRRRTNNQKPRERRTLIPAFDPKDLAKELEQEANRTTVSPPFDPSSYARILEDHLSVAGVAHDSPRTMAAAAKIAEAVATPGYRPPDVVNIVVDDETPPQGDVEWSEGEEELDEESLSIEVVPRENVRRARTMTAPTPPMVEQQRTFDMGDMGGDDEEASSAARDAETIGREMYGSYLASDFPEALVLAERLIELEPDHALAQLVLERCKERLCTSTGSPRMLNPSSVLRLKFSELERQSSRIDPTSSFVLGHIDGVSDAATVAALTGLDNTDALERLHALLDLGVLELVSA